MGLAPILAFIGFLTAFAGVPANDAELSAPAPIAYTLSLALDDEMPTCTSIVVSIYEYEEAYDWCETMSPTCGSEDCTVIVYEGTPSRCICFP